MGENLEYAVSIDVKQALRDVGNLAAALKTQLAGAARQAQDALAALQRTRVPSAAELLAGGSARSSNRARPAALPVAALGAGAIGARLALPASGAQPPPTSPATRSAMAATAAVTAAREIASEAKAAFAPLRLALSHLALPGRGSGGGAAGARPALPAGSGRGGVIDVESTLVSQKDKAPNAFAQAWQRAVGGIRSLFTRLRESAAGIVAKIDVAGAISNLRNLSGRIGEVRKEVEKTKREGESGGGLLGSVGSLAKGALLPLAALAGGYLSLSFAAHQFHDAIKQAADFEQMQVGFSVLLRSGAKAKAMLADLTQFADQTPMQLPELAQATRTLLAFGVPATEVMKDLRQLGDIAAGVQQPIGEIAELFGKCRTEGTLFSIDIRELTRRGIPVIGELAKQFHVSEAAVHKLAETGRIKFADLQKAIGSLTSGGGMFAGMLGAQAQTFSGMVTTMKDRLGALYRTFGAPLLGPLKAGVGEITTILGGWKDRAREWGATLANVLRGVTAIIQNGDAGKAMGAALQLGFAEAVNVLYKGAVATVAALAEGISGAISVLTKALFTPSLGKFLMDVFNAAAYSLVAIVEKGIADAIRNLPGMKDRAANLDLDAVSQGMNAKISLQGARRDLQQDDMKALAAQVAAAKANVAAAFTKAFSTATGPMDTNAPKAALAAVLGRANARNNPLPIYTDNEGHEYGPGSPYGSPDSQMPKPGTPPTAADLSAGLRGLLHGVQPVAAADPGPGTIGGKAAADVLGTGNRGVLPPFNASPRPLTLPAPRQPPTLPIPALGARATAFVGGTSARPDPRVDTTNQLLGALVAAFNAHRPKPAIAGIGMA